MAENDSEPFDYSLFDQAKPTHAHLMRIQAQMVRKMDRIESRTLAKFDHLLEALGHENDTANGGTGIVGRLARIEARQRLADRWFAMILGGVSAGGAFAAALWWVVGDKIGKLIKPV